jgi:membrane protein YqaA with SNARE-associated domain
MLEYGSYFIEGYGLLGVLVGTFLSFSVLPVPTDPVIIAAVGYFNPLLVFFVAMVGSTLGSITNYYIGLKGVRFFLRNKNSKNERKAERIFEKWGLFGLIFFSGLPFIGDPLIILAGTLRVGFWKFLFYTTLGKIWYFVLLIWFGIVLFG